MDTTRIETRLRRSFYFCILCAAVCVGVIYSVSVSDAYLDFRAESIEPTRFSFLALGDTGKSRSFGMTSMTQLAVGRSLTAEHRTRPADLLVFLGDNLYDFAGSAEDPERRIEANFARPYCTFLSDAAPLFRRIASACSQSTSERRPIPIFAVLGNHDHEDPRSEALQQDQLQTYIANWNAPKEVVHTLEQNGVSLIFYDSQKIHEQAQYRALQEALAAARGPWRILIAHNPIEQDAKSQKILDAIRASGATVHLHLAGHDHNLQLAATPSAPILLQAISGAGAEARELRHEIPGRRFAAIAPGFLRVDITDGSNGRDERLLVSLFEAPRALLSDLDSPTLRSCWSVTQYGEIRDEIHNAIASR